MTKHEINPVLVDVADWRVRGDAEKKAFVPPGMDPMAAGGGAPPMGAPPMGAPPMGAPPMDPAAMGGAPPMDPAMAAGGAPPMDPVIQQAITQAVQTAMGGGAGGPGGPAGAGPGKGAGKVDPGLIYMEMGRIRKMMTTMFQNLGWELPPDILDDEMVAQSVVGGAPAGQPTDAAGGAPPAPPADPAAGGAPPLPPGIDPAALQGMPGTGGGGGGEKMGADNRTIGEVLFGKRADTTEVVPTIVNFNDKVDALAAMARQLNGRR